MRMLFEIVKTTVVGGLLVVVPVLVIALLLDEIVALLIAVMTPLADLFPEGWLPVDDHPELLAIGLLLASSLAVGLAMRLGPVRAFGAWVERHTLEHLPMYRVLRRLVRAFGRVEEGETFSSGILRSADGVREIVMIIEDSGGDHLTVLVPWAPAGLAGNVRIVPRERVEPIDATLGDVTRVLGNWGFGVEELIAPARRRAPASSSVDG